MNIEDIARVKAEIKFVPIYRCKCGFVQTGDTRFIEVDTFDASDLLHIWGRQRHTAHAMPVGWGSYSNDGTDIRCPSCVNGV